MTLLLRDHLFTQRNRIYGHGANERVALLKDTFSHHITVGFLSFFLGDDIFTVEELVEHFVRTRRALLTSFLA